MFKIKVFTIGKCKEAWLEEALSDYEKRLHREVTVEWILCKDDKGLSAQAEREDSYIALDPKGMALTSERLSRELSSYFSQNGPRLSLFIGGADGLTEAVRKKAKALWSLSPLTFTHQMTRLILLEQIYRAFEIAKGSQYHR